MFPWIRKVFCSIIPTWHLFSSVQFGRSVVSDSLRPHESQHTRPPCPSPTPGVHPNSCPSSRWCHPAISSSAIPFSSCPQSLPPSIRVFSNELNEVLWVCKRPLSCVDIPLCFVERTRATPWHFDSFFNIRMHLSRWSVFPCVWFPPIWLREQIWLPLSCAFLNTVPGAHSTRWKQVSSFHKG